MSLRGRHGGRCWWVTLPTEGPEGDFRALSTLAECITAERVRRGLDTPSFFERGGRLPFPAADQPPVEPAVRLVVTLALNEPATLDWLIHPLELAGEATEVAPGVLEWYNPAADAPWEGLRVTLLTLLALGLPAQRDHLLAEAARFDFSPGFPHHLLAAVRAEGGEPESAPGPR